MDENGEVANEKKEDVEVCSECNEAAEKYLDEHNKNRLLREHPELKP